MRTSKHKITLLKWMKERGEVTAGLKGLGISNANQYLGELRRDGVITAREEINEDNGVRFNLWRIVDHAKVDKILKGEALRKIDIGAIKTKTAPGKVS